MKIKKRETFCLQFRACSCIVLEPTQNNAVRAKKRNQKTSGLSEVWYRAWFGTRRPWVQVPQPGPYGTQVLIRYLRSFSYCQIPLGTKIFSTSANEIRFIVSKLNIQKLKLSDSNLPYFEHTKSQ